MRKYVVTIECREKFVYETEADDENYAIEEAFDHRHAWENLCEANSFNVTVKKKGDVNDPLGGDVE